MAKKKKKNNYKNLKKAQNGYQNNSKSDYQNSTSIAQIVQIVQMNADKLHK